MIVAWMKGNQSKTHNMAKKIEGYTTEFAQRRLPANGSVDFVRVPAAPNNSPATIVVHDGDKHEPVFTESEVRAMLRTIRHELELNTRWQNQVEVVSASAMRQAFHRPDVLSLDPA